MPKPYQPIDETAALADALNGMKTGQLQTKYRIGYARAAAITKKAREQGMTESEEVDPTPDAEDPAEAYTLSIDVKASNLEALLAGLKPTLADYQFAVSQLCDQDKAAIVQGILQSRTAQFEPPVADEAQDA
jgi:hypothetical protein